MYTDVTRRCTGEIHLYSTSVVSLTDVTCCVGGAPVLECGQPRSGPGHRQRSDWLASRHT
jgi:hypothetical protein